LHCFSTFILKNFKQLRVFQYFLNIHWEGNLNCKLFLSAAVSFFIAWSLNGTFRGSTETPKAIEDPALEPALYHSAVLESSRVPDRILAAYRDEAAHSPVVEFFTALSGSKEFAVCILECASEYEIDPALAFALCWEESRYDPWACHRNPNSFDRGLFQLNSLVFSQLSEADFYNPETNIHHGLKHLRWCLDQGGSDISGLALYNAGIGMVSKGGTPKQTLNYIANVIRYRDGIELLFREEIRL
jgi:hypothetical protein